MAQQLPDFESISSCMGSPSSTEPTYWAASSCSLVTFSWGWKHSSRRNNTVREVWEPLTAVLCSFVINISAVTRISRPTTSTRRQYHTLVTSRSAMECRRGASLKAFCSCEVDSLPSSSSSRQLHGGRKMASNLQLFISSTSQLLIYSQSSTDRLKLRQTFVHILQH